MDVDDKAIPHDVLVALSGIPSVTREVRRLANDIAEDARQLAPRRTGELAEHGIGVNRRKAKDGAVFYAVGWTGPGFYGYFVEVGTETATPHPHLVPAAIKHGAVAGNDSDDGVDVGEVFG